MYSFLTRHLPIQIANILAIIWYALLIAGILVCYDKDVGGFLYLHL